MKSSKACKQVYLPGAGEGGGGCTRAGKGEHRAYPANNVYESDKQFAFCCGTADRVIST